MPKKAAQPELEKKAKASIKKIKKHEREYHFPAEGVTIKAGSLQEANEKLKKLLSNN